jgi:heavy metal sensor kinase
MRLGVRWRLTLWNTLTFAVILIGFAFFVYLLLSRALYQKIDGMLATELVELTDDARLASNAQERLRHWIDDFKEHHNILTVVFSGDGAVVDRTAELTKESIPSAPSGDFSKKFFFDTSLPLIGRQRCLASLLRLGGQEQTILLMASLAEVDQELNRLLTVTFAAIPASLCVAAGFGYLLARKALQPVDRMRLLTQQITAQSLDQRLPVEAARDELGLLAETINGMIGRLERSFNEIRRFTADASHELRTPLTAIRAETEIALTRQLNAQECNQLLGSILEECERLTQLTDQLLALSREDTLAHQPPEPVDLTALVQDIVETLHPVAEAKALQLSVSEKSPITLQGDHNRLRQVFFNLLDNAIKYTPQGGRVEVRINHQDHLAVVIIADTGIGIAVEHIPHVFDRFYRVDKARTRKAGGTGLGLSIAESIILAHGGRIKLESTQGQGTTCIVTLPLEPQ